MGPAPKNRAPNHCRSNIDTSKKPGIEIPRRVRGWDLVVARKSLFCPFFGLCAAKDGFGKWLFTIARGAIFFLKYVFFSDLSDGKNFFSKKSLKNGQNRGFLKILYFLKNRVRQKSIVFNRFSMTWEKNEYHHRKDQRKIHI